MYSPEMEMDLRQIASNATALHGLATIAAGLRCILWPRTFAATFGLPLALDSADDCSCSCSCSYSSPSKSSSTTRLGGRARTSTLESRLDLMMVADEHRIAAKEHFSLCPPCSPSLSVVAPAPAPASHWHKTNPFVALVGVRTVAAGLCLVAFSVQRMPQATGIVLCCNLLSMLGDVVVCYRQGTPGSTRSHLLASSVSALLGGYMLLSKP